MDEWPRADDRPLPIVARSAVDVGGRAGKPFRDIEPAVLDPPSPCARRPSVMPTWPQNSPGFRPHRKRWRLSGLNCAAIEDGWRSGQAAIAAALRADT